MRVVDKPYGTEARTKDMKVTLSVDRDRFISEV